MPVLTGNMSQSFKLRTGQNYQVVVQTSLPLADFKFHQGPIKLVVSKDGGEAPCKNASGVTYNPNDGRLYLVQNQPHKVWSFTPAEVDAAASGGKLLLSSGRNLRKTCKEMEDLCFFDGSYFMCEEEYEENDKKTGKGRITQLSLNGDVQVAARTVMPTANLEGLTIDTRQRRLLVAERETPQIFELALNDQGLLASSASKETAITAKFAETGFRDISALHYSDGILLGLSVKDYKVLEIYLDDMNRSHDPARHSLALEEIKAYAAQAGVKAQVEGMCLVGDSLYICCDVEKSSKNVDGLLFVYKKNASGSLGDVAGGGTDTATTDTSNTPAGHGVVFGAAAGATNNATDTSAGELTDEGVPAFTQSGVAGPKLESHIDQLLQIGGFGPSADHDNQNFSEQIPFSLCKEIIEDGNVGLLALFIGAANWGVSGLPGDLNPNPFKCSAWDSEYFGGGQGASSWKGRGKGAGKHVMDHAKGGLGIAHWDSGSLEDFHGMFNVTDSGVAKEWAKEKFDWMRDRGIGEHGHDTSTKASNGLSYAENWKNWKQWALKLLRDKNFQTTNMIRRWLDKYFAKGLSKNAQDVYKAAVWSRARSSGKAGGLAGKPVAEQVTTYLSKRKRQGQFCLRVVALAAYVKGATASAGAQASDSQTQAGSQSSQDPNGVADSGSQVVFGQTATSQQNTDPGGSQGGYQPVHATGSGGAGGSQVVFGAAAQSGGSSSADTQDSSGGATSSDQAQASSDQAQASSDQAQASSDQDPVHKDQDSGTQTGTDQTTGQGTTTDAGPTVHPEPDDGPLPATPPQEEDYSPVNKDFKLTGTVDSDGQGDPKDVEKVQTRLKALGYVDGSFVEPSFPRLLKICKERLAEKPDHEFMPNHIERYGEYPRKQYGPLLRLQNEIYDRFKDKKFKYLVGGRDKLKWKSDRCGKVVPNAMTHLALLRPFDLEGTVGNGGLNRPWDVQKLKERLWAVGLLEWSAIDGTCDAACIEKIQAFQKLEPETDDASGAIGPGSMSHRKLNGFRPLPYQNSAPYPEAGSAHSYKLEALLQTKPNGCGDWYGEWTCGPSSVALTARYFKPQYGRGLSQFELMTHLAEESGCTLSGTSVERQQKMLKLIGLNFERSSEDTDTVAWMRKQLEAGKIIVSGGNSRARPHQTPKEGHSGHWLAIVGLTKDGQFVFMDPGRNAHGDVNTKPASEEQLVQWMKNKRQNDRQIAVSPPGAVPVMPWK